MKVSTRFLELAVDANKMNMVEERQFFGNKRIELPFIDKNNRRLVLGDVVCIGLPKSELVGRVSYLRGSFGVYTKDKFFPFYDMFIDGNKIIAVQIVNINYILDLYKKLHSDEKMYESGLILSKYSKIISPNGKVL